MVMLMPPKNWPAGQLNSMSYCASFSGAGPVNVVSTIAAVNFSFLLGDFNSNGQRPYERSIIIVDV